MRRLALAPLVLLAACSSRVFVEKPPNQKTEDNIKITIQPTPADVLFVVDNSGSMQDEQENLARNFEAFINATTAASGSYRIGIVTTDQMNTTELEGLVQSSFAAGDPNKLSGVARDACVATSIETGCFRGPDPNRRIVSSTEPADAQAQSFAANVQVGTCGSGTEEGLAAAINALERAAAGGCNEGFLRDDANLVIVFVSDEEDASPDSISDYVNRLAALKPLDQVRIGLVIGSDGGEASQCGIGLGSQCGGACDRVGPPQGSMTSCQTNNDCANGEACVTNACVDSLYEYWEFGCYWCSFYNASDCCSALPGQRYVDFADAVASARSSVDVSCADSTGCLIDSICQEDFSDTLSRIARELLAPTEYPLNPPAVYPPGVEVHVNGIPLDNGTDFVVSDDGTTLTFLTGTPEEDATIEIFAIIAN